MMFPEFIGGFTMDEKKELVVVLEKTKQFIWDGKESYMSGKSKEFICHAIEEAWCDDLYLYRYITLKKVLTFIQLNIDTSMGGSHFTYACWNETIHTRPLYHEREKYRQYIINLQFNRKAWVDYLINNLKGD
jgi:hypothetical protein